MSEEVRNAMTTEHKRPRWSRWAGVGLGAALLMVLTGDGIGQAGISGGIDPLDVLDLQVKPNVIVVLDSSGSMQETLYRDSGGGAVNFNTGDWRESKMGLAKSVLTSVITGNATKANFLFGQYTQASSVMQRTGINDGNGRFRYLTTVDWNDVDDDNTFEAGDTVVSGSQDMRTACPSATTTTPCELTLAGRGFQSWQWIQPGWNQLYYQEGGVNCAVTITPGFYRTQADLITELQTRMNGCAGRPGTPNVYTVITQTNGRFRFSAPTNQFILQWQSGSPNNIAGALAAYSGTTGAPQQPTYANATVNTGSNYTTQNSLRLLWRDIGFWDEEVNFDPDGSGPLTTRDRTTYYLRANKAWNGELFYVDGAGATCGFDAASPVKTDPPSVRIQQVSTCTNPTGSLVGSVVTFEWGGGVYGGNNISCNGFQVNARLPRCDAAPPSNINIITANLELQFGMEHDTASAAFGTILGYTERTDGTHQMLTLPSPAGIHADGATPIANSLIDIQPVFSNLWFNAQTDDPGTPYDETRGPIRTQTSPRERTIILFVTDGDDTCPDGGGGSDDNAKRAAHKAEQLFAELEAGFPESSVTTYSIGFGTGASTDRLNWIGWGGSGMGQNATGQPDVATTGGGTQQRWNETKAQLDAKRALCTTCIDAFIAPDAATLAAQLQAILDQGATLGEFTAQQSVFTSILELVADAGGDPDSPTDRYNVFVPNLIRASFTMPGFKGQVRALQNKGTIVENWNAGQKLFDRVNTALASCSDSGTAGECSFTSLLTRIDRRIYTSSGNGAFTATINDLTSETWLTTDGNRKELWPADSAIAPQDDTTWGQFDQYLGLTQDNDAAAFNSLQAAYDACAGTPLAGPCSGSDAQKTARARREARERILAFMAGAQIVVDGTTGLPKRLANGNMVFVRRDWVLADSTLAVPGVLGPPIQPEPTGSGFEAEYLLFRDSIGGSQSANDAAARIGFGLRNDGGSGTVVANPAFPSMTVTFIPANDMLHAFRAGPSCGVPPYSSCAELGGIELWGYVPFDQLAKLSDRLLVTQTRANHTYMVAASVRFADVFVPNPGTTSDPSGTTVSLTVAGTSQTVKGVWRRLLFFGRGIAGKFLTALDVTTAGDYKTTVSNTIPPAVLWSRGNPDSDPDDDDFYLKMGETWSVPTVAFVDRASNTTPRKVSGVDFVLYVGSGYGETAGCPGVISVVGAPCEGQTFFTLDALTGDIVAAADIPAATGEPTGGYANSLVANAVSFNPGEFQAAALGSTGHPASTKAERAYIGDLHGRVWKILSSDPATPLLVTDLGIEQPIAVAVSVLGFDESGTTVPFVYVNSGYDRRQDPALSGEAFLLAGIKDDQTTALSPADACKQTPVVAPCLFATELTQQLGADTGFFRGTIQPAVTIGTAAGVPVGRVFFAGTRFNPPAPEGAPFAPPPPPCKSSFDSILFALGAKSGEAAFDLNDDPAADDSYVVFDNSKIAGLGIIAAPDGTGGTSTQLTVDEGLMSQTGGGGAGGNCVGGEGPDCIPPGGPTPGAAGGGGGVTTTSFRPSSTICN